MLFRKTSRPRDDEKRETLIFRGALAFELVQMDFDGDEGFAHRWKSYGILFGPARAALIGWMAWIQGS